LQEARESLKQEPQDVDSLQQAAQAAVKLSDFATALTYSLELEKQLSADARLYANALMQTAEALIPLNRQAELIQQSLKIASCAEQMLADGDESYQPHALLALARRLQNRNAESYVHLRKAIPLGFIGSKTWSAGPLMVWLQSDPEFKEILASSEKRIEDMRNRIRELERSAGGLLNPEQIRAAVIKHSDDIQRCYRPVLAKNNGRGGEVVVGFAILGSGRVTEPLVEATTIATPEVEQCLVAALSSWSFPVAKGGGRIFLSYPFSWPIPPPQATRGLR
jgi:hypothetical protein